MSEDYIRDRTEYIGLLTFVPDYDSPNSADWEPVEVDDPTYHRQRFGAKIGTEESGSWINVETITFPKASRDWGVAKGFGLYDREGRLLASLNVITPMFISVDMVVSIPSGMLVARTSWGTPRLRPAP